MEVPTTPDNIHLLTARAIFPRLEVAPAAVAGIERMILLCFTNRSGSWLLADLLRTSGMVGVAGEALNGDEMARAADRGRLRDFSAFVAHEIAGRAVQGAVLLKCGLLHLELMGRSGLLDVLGERVRFVHIERVDRLGQAISWVIAEQTGSGAAAGWQRASRPTALPRSRRRWSASRRTTGASTTSSAATAWCRAM